MKLQKLSIGNLPASMPIKNLPTIKMYIEFVVFVRKRNNPAMIAIKLFAIRVFFLEKTVNNSEEIFKTDFSQGTSSLVW